MNKLFSPLIFIWLTLLLSLSVKAHTVELFYADYQPQNGELVVNFDVAYAIPEIRDVLESPQPKRSWLIQLTDQQHEELRLEAERYIRSYIQFQVNNIPIDYQVSFPDFDQKPYPFLKLLNEGAYYTIALSPKLPNNTSKSLTIKVNDGPFPNLTIAHETDGVKLFETVKPSMLFDLKLELEPKTSPQPVNQHEPTPVPAQAPATAPSSFSYSELIILGFRHVIPDGLDHVLFIIGICLMAGNIRQLLWQSLVFTFAHATSMALVISQVFPAYSYGASAYIEATIALSIAFIAIESLWFSSVLKWRFILIALFGFIHGLGFAGSLGSTLQFLSADNWVLPLIWANLGIELAQAILVISCYSLLIYLKNNHSAKLEKNLRIAIAVIIAAFGLVWFLQRLP